MKLSIFDFDGTLTAEWGRWNEPVVAAARRAYKQGYSVLLTGRPEAHRADVLTALREHNIPFHRIVTVGPLFTGNKKRAEIERLVNALGPDEADVWDDKRDLLESYGRLLANMGVERRLFLVGGRS